MEWGALLLPQGHLLLELKKAWVNEKDSLQAMVVYLWKKTAK